MTKWEYHDDCSSDDDDCMREGWEWEDGTRYEYRSHFYHNWKDDEPDFYDKCAVIAFRGWEGVPCPVDTLKFPYICEEGNYYIEFLYCVTGT